MDKPNKIIFLSAGIPFIADGRDPKYFESADIIAIRDSVRALATLSVCNNWQIVWGGQPSITPLIKHVMETLKSSKQRNVKLYQSKFFVKEFLTENTFFEQIVLTESIDNNRDKSLKEMRERMFRENNFSVAIFIGGMDGIENEFEIFRSFHPILPAYPIASTGGGALEIYKKYEKCFDFPKSLITEYAYMDLFKKLIIK
jgi:hypothetical protein